MHRNLYLLLFLILSLHGVAQEYMDFIAQESCECMDKLDPNLSNEQITMQAGICMIKAASPYEKKLKKDYGINMANLVEAGEQLGQVIALRMVEYCPASLLMLAERVNDQEETEETTTNSVIGTIMQVEVQPFVCFTIKTNDGKSGKYYWLTFVESNLDLTNNFGTMQDKVVECTYESVEVFDPRIGEYRNINVLNSLQALED